MKFYQRPSVLMAIILLIAAALSFIPWNRIPVAADVSFLQNAAIGRSEKAPYLCSGNDQSVCYWDYSQGIRQVYYQDVGMDGSLDQVFTVTSGTGTAFVADCSVIGQDPCGESANGHLLEIYYLKSDDKAALDLQAEYINVRTKYAAAHPSESKQFPENAPDADTGPARNDASRVNAFVGLHRMWKEENNSYRKELLESLLHDSYQDMRNSERRSCFRILNDPNLNEYLDLETKSETWERFHNLWLPNSNPEWNMDNVPEAERQQIKEFLAQLRYMGLA